MRLLNHRITGRSLVLISSETALIVSAITIGAYVRLGEFAWDIALYENGIAKALLIAAVTQTCLYYTDLYDLRRLGDRRELFTRLLQALAPASFILAALYFWFPALVIGRGVFLIAAILVVMFVIGWRIAFEWTSGHIAPRERLLLVGTNSAAVMLAGVTCKSRYCGQRMFCPRSIHSWWREIWLEKLSEAPAEREAACEDREARCEERKVA